MTRISDELREFADAEVLSAIQISDLKHMAKRIDAEMVELPISADGKIWTGREECFWIEARGGAWSRHSLLSLDIIDGSRWYVRDTGGIEYEAGAVWFERPDSFERIAEELDEMADSEHTEDDMCEKLAGIADRIRKLAESED